MNVYDPALSQRLSNILFTLIALFFLAGVVAWISIWWPLGVVYFIALLMTYNHHDELLVYGY